jgi:predicted Zn-dependent protease
VLFASRPASGHAAIDVQIEDLTRRIAQHPGDAGLFLRRGELHRVHSDWSAAEADYRRARRLDPGLAEVDFCLGRMFLEQGRPEAAKVELDRFLDRKPGDPEGLTMRARALARMGRRDEAADDYRVALASLAARGADDPNTFLELADLLSAGDHPWNEEALSVLDKGIAALGPIVSLELPAIAIEMALRHYDGALVRLDAIASQSARKEPWILKRADILRQAGRRTEAATAYQEVLAIVAALPEPRRASPSVTKLVAAARTGLEQLALPETQSTKAIP